MTTAVCKSRCEKEQNLKFTVSPCENVFENKKYTSHQFMARLSASTPLCMPVPCMAMYTQYTERWRILTQPVECSH